MAWATSQAGSSGGAAAEGFAPVPCLEGLEAPLFLEGKKDRRNIPGAEHCSFALPCFLHS